MGNKFCKVCGYELGFAPWGENNNSPSFEICPCCGAEFGYDDYTTESIKTYRSNWIKSGAKWFDPNMMPNNWCLQQQLHNIKNFE